MKPARQDMPALQQLNALLYLSGRGACIPLSGSVQGQGRVLWRCHCCRTHGYGISDRC